MTGSLLVTGVVAADVQWLAQHLPALLPGVGISTATLDTLAQALSAGSVPDAVHGGVPNGLIDQRVLLSGLDTPAAAGAAMQQADSALRELLAQGGVAYSVVYGQGLQRLQNAQRLVCPAPLSSAQTQKRWVCEKCSDPDCEFKLFTGLKGLSAENHPVP